MNIVQKAGLAITAGAVAIGVGIASTGGGADESATKPCILLIADHGAFRQSDGTGRCALTFQRPGRRACSMHPVAENSISYPWSYDVTATGAVVLGLRVGAELAFDCTTEFDSP